MSGAAPAAPAYRARMRLPHGYTNETRRDGDVVTKRYVGEDAVGRLRLEQGALESLAGRLPVPPVVGSTVDPPCLRLAWVAGRHGQELVDEGRAAAVLAACGRLLGVLQDVPPDDLPGVPGVGPVVVHGDFGPQNLLLDDDGGVPVALLDWELVHRGDPVEDLAWAEWIVRAHHPTAVGRLDALFSHSGSRPPWADRHAAMVGACRAQLARAERAGDLPGVRRWTGRVARAARFAETP